MPTIRRKKRHTRPKAKIDLIDVLIQGGGCDWTPQEIEEIARHMTLIGANAQLEQFLQEHETWKQRPPEAVLSDAAGMAILADPCAYAQRVPTGFKCWLLAQPDGEKLWRGWLEEIRQSQIERRKANV